MAIDPNTSLALLPVIAAEATTSQDGDCVLSIAFLTGTTPVAIDITSLVFGLNWYNSSLGDPNTFLIALAGSQYLVNGGSTGVLSLNIPQAKMRMLALGSYTASLIVTYNGQTIDLGSISIIHSLVGPSLITSLVTTPRNAASATSIGYVPGPSGLSAYQVALVNGYSGTQSQWLASLQGNPGVGSPGAPGAAATVQVGSTTTVTAGTPAAVTNAGTSSAAILDFTIPQGATGPANSLGIGTVATGAPGSSAAATITGSAPSQTLNLTIPQGATGNPGTGVLRYDAAQTLTPTQTLQALLNIGFIPRSYLTGFTLSNDATTPNTLLDISSGVAFSDDNTTFMSLGSTIVKSIAASWAVGSGNGGLDIGSVLASTWYHVYGIERLDTGVVDVLFSQAPSLKSTVTVTSASPAVFTWGGGSLPFQNGAPQVLSGTTVPGGFTAGTVYYVVAANQLAGSFSLAATQGGTAINSTTTGTAVVATSNPVFPTNYTVKRRLGSIQTDTSSHILSFTQRGDEFLRAIAPPDVNSTGSSTTAVIYNMASVPIGAKVQIRFRAIVGNPNTATVGVLFNSIDETSVVVGAGNASLITGNGTNFYSAGEFTIRTGFSQQLRVVAAAPATTVAINTYGWYDTRGRND